MAEETPARYCGNCGHELSPTDQFCRNCGTPVHKAARVPTPEADVPVPPPPQAGGGAGGGDATAVQAPPQERVGWSRALRGWLIIFGVFAFLTLVGGCLAGLAALAGSGGGNEVANKAEKNKESGGGKDATPKPELAISAPSGSPTVTKDSIEVKGKVTPANSKVAVNGQEVTTDKDGAFSTSYYLNVGENYIKITAVKGSEQAEASRVVTRKLSEKEIAAQGAAEEKAKAGERQVQQNEQQPQAEQNPSPQAEYTVGQTAQVANVQWRVSDAYLTNQLRSNCGTQKRGRFVVVDFTFTNNRNEEVTLDPELHMVLKDRRGREFGTDVDSWEFMPTNLNIFLEPVNPGISKNGRVIYQVPPDAWGFTLRLDDVEFWEDKSAVFDLSGLTPRAYTYHP